MPPKAALDSSNTKGATPSAASLRLEVIASRADFLKAAKASKASTPAFILQARKTGSDKMRVGFTCSKKVGNAVARNRAKRRLREIARLVLPDAGRTGYDYVLIGRADATASRDFAQMQRDLAQALTKIHA